MLVSIIHLISCIILFCGEKQSSFAFLDNQEQHVFHQNNQQINSNSILSPFSYEWIQLLEQFHNTLGNKNNSKDDGACLFPVPTFDCEPFIWHDAILDRDAYHLRPNVSVAQYKMYFRKKVFSVSYMHIGY